jgi:hypothetical protein
VPGTVAPGRSTQAVEDVRVSSASRTTVTFVVVPPSARVVPLAN